MTDQQTPARLSVGEWAPDFTLPDAHGRPMTLSDLRGGRVILYFYPAAATPGCTKQACDFRDNLASFAAQEYSVIGISPDPPIKLAKFAQAEELTFPLLSDVDRSVMTSYAAFGEKSLYGKKVQGVLRSTFVINAEGRLELAQYSVRASGHVAKLRRDLGLLA